VDALVEAAKGEVAGELKTCSWLSVSSVSAFSVLFSLPTSFSAGLNSHPSGTIAGGAASVLLDLRVEVRETILIVS